MKLSCYLKITYNLNNLNQFLIKIMKLFDAQVALDAFDAYLENDYKYHPDITVKNFEIVRGKLKSAADENEWDYIFEILQDELNGRKALLQQIEPYTDEDYLVRYEKYCIEGENDKYD